MIMIKGEGNVCEGIDVESPSRPSDVLLDAFETMQNASLYSLKYDNEIRSLALKSKNY